MPNDRFFQSTIIKIRDYGVTVVASQNPPENADDIKDAIDNLNSFATENNASLHPTDELLTILQKPTAVSKALLHLMHTIFNLPCNAWA